MIPTMPEERLQKILARAGAASRRRAEELILEGRVAVDGVVKKELGSKADPSRQRITLDGRDLSLAQERQYWLAHKPPGLVCTLSDPQGRPRVVDLLPPGTPPGMFPVGRLDLDSEGLVLLTNDGELAYRLMHPRFGVSKAYRVWVAGKPSLEALQSLRQGVVIAGRPTRPARVYLKGGDQLRSKLTMVLQEGRKREIRLMCAVVGHPVVRLVRVQMGPLHLGDLPQGAVRPLAPAEIQGLRAAAGLAAAGEEVGCKPTGHGVKKGPHPGTRTGRPARTRGQGEKEGR